MPEKDHDRVFEIYEQIIDEEVRKQDSVYKATIFHFVNGKVIGSEEDIIEMCIRLNIMSIPRTDEVLNNLHCIKVFKHKRRAPRYHNFNLNDYDFNHTNGDYFFPPNNNNNHNNNNQ